MSQLVVFIKIFLLYANMYLFIFTFICISIRFIFCFNVNAQTQVYSTNNHVYRSLWKSFCCVILMVTFLGTG